MLIKLLHYLLKKKHPYALVPLDAIRVRPLPLGVLEEEKLQKILDAHHQGVELPPILLWEINKKLYLKNGQHRLAVAAHLGKKDIKAHIFRVTDKPDWFDLKRYSESVSYLGQAVKELQMG